MTVMNQLILIVIGVLAFSAILCLIRAILGPSGPDRVVAIDALTGVGIAILALVGINYHPFFLDVALVYALLAFLGGVAIAKYLEGKGLEE